MFCILKKNKYVLYIFQKLFDIAKINNYFNDSKRRKIRLRLSYCKKLPALLKGMMPKNYSDFYCLNCLHSFATKNKMESHEKVCIIKNFCRIALQTQKKCILEFDQYMKSGKMSYILYADIESLVKEIGNSKNNPEKISTAKIGKRISCRYSMSTLWEFDHIENKYSLYRGEHYMKKFFESLREHAKNINDFEKKKVLSFTKKSKSHINMQRNVTFMGKKSLKIFQKIKITKKLKIIAILQVNTEAQHIAFVI